MDIWIKINASSAGKDKLLRTAQYILKITNHYHQKRHTSVDTFQQWKNLETTISSFRKLLRLGKSVEVLRGATRTLRLADPVHRLTLTLGRIAQCLFLAADHLIWLSRARLVTIDNKKWESIYYRCWLYSVTMNLCRDVYDIWRAAELYTSHGLPVLPSSPHTLLPWGQQAFPLLLQRHRALALDSLKNVCDVVLPLAALGHLNISPAVQGLCGVVSSLIMLCTVTDPNLSLRPS